MTRKGWFATSGSTTFPGLLRPIRAFLPVAVAAPTLSYIGTFLLQRRRRWLEIKSITLRRREPILLWFGDLNAYLSTEP